MTSVEYAPPSFGNLLGSMVSPRMFGGVGDGVADDSAALQAAVDYCLGGNPAAGSGTARAPKHGVTLDGGAFGLNHWRITVAPQIYSVQGFNMIGDGEECKILLSGALAKGLDLDGNTRCTYADFTVSGATATDTATAAVSLDWTPAKSARSSSGNRFIRILVRNLKYVTAFAFGNNSASLQVDNNRCWDCSAEGQWTAGEVTWWQSGFKSGSGTFGNILGHQHYACSGTANRYNFHVWALSSYNVYGGSAGNSEADFYGQALGDACSINGLRTENSQRLVVTGASGSRASLTLRDILFDSPNVPGDNQVIQFGYGGQLLIDNVTVSQQCASPQYRLNGNATKVASVIVRGGSTGTAGGSLVTSGGASAPFVAHLDGYQQTTAGQVVATSTQLVYTQAAVLAASLT